MSPVGKSVRSLPKFGSAEVMSAPPKRHAVGRPKPLPLCSVFLLSPVAALPLDGLPTMRELFKEVGLEHHYRVIEPLMDGRASATEPNMFRSAHAILTEIGTGLPDVVRRALFEDDEQAKEEVNSWGQWEACRMGLSSVDGTLLDWTTAHCIEVEQASVEAERLIHSGDFSGAASLIRRDDRLKVYMTNRMAADLARAQSNADSVRARAAAMLEFQLSQVARVEVRLQAQSGAIEGGGFLPLLMPAKNGRLRPGGEFLRWLQHRLGLPTIKSVLDYSAMHSQAGDSPVNEATLKRWSSGTSFPSLEKLRVLVRALLTTHNGGMPSQTEMDAVSYKFWAARRFHFVLSMAQRVIDRDHAIPEPRRLLYLLDASSLNEWCHCRYAWWLTHWASQAEAA